MGKASKIEWTDHTFNIAWGCTKIGPGCDNCYADTWAKRLGTDLWGTDAPRRTFGTKHWDEPLRWDRLAGERGVRERVFCSSMADIFENHPALPPERSKLWSLIEGTQNLDWLLLTKRIGNVPRMVPEPWGVFDWPANVWLGASIVNQEEADRDLPKLLAIPARVRFLSCEPLLGPIDVTPWFPDCYECSATCGWRGNAPPEERCRACDERSTTFGEFCICGAQQFSHVCPECGADAVTDHPDTQTIHWTISGGESGPKARPSHPDWHRSLRDQCAAAGVPFLFKQWGEWAPGECASGPPKRTERAAHWWGNSWTYVTLTPRASFETHRDDEPDLYRLGKKAAGRLLDGREHNEFPEAK